jgi:choline dehydrogenase
MASPLVADLPGVGDDLNDHISGRIMLRCKGTTTVNNVTRNWGTKLACGLHFQAAQLGERATMKIQLWRAPLSG